MNLRKMCRSNAYRILVREIEGKRPLRRQNRWKNIRMYIREEVERVGVDWS
jgi:hypothetical protein